ncbi:hypothetical protein HF888_15165 [Bermanella marisrubri]|uniref:Uncharacterized protein n=1 Tax=Bermanella marisrubri TaxID=207949 RepID=Q1N2K8_9GAMM|nr:hypothetical protein [Bermanella marisrubri]EAT12399.1 hypothetical protein RED65_16216 [Oceanobacter sp. RED65] [Bermanella marisrubri]QIZ85480.1 hypothetical protein HF888_15165 [Bermanella marisrubri]
MVVKRYLDAQARYLATASRLLGNLRQEKRETQEMMQTFFQLLTQKLPQGRRPDEAEIKAALEQLKDVHKMAGLFLIALTPGSVITFPALCALGRRYGIELLPSAFQKGDETEVEILEQVILNEIRHKRDDPLSQSNDQDTKLKQ